MRVKTGLDILLKDPEKYLEGGVGLITNPTSVTATLVPSIDAFKAQNSIKLKVVFGPEHGVSGNVQDALSVNSYYDKDSGLTIHSLYGDVMKPDIDMLDGVDTLVFDVQDVGARFYTYISTMIHAIEAASEWNLRFVVLDRPNPINGVDMEGGLLERGFESFIGLHPLPYRHGLTIGELALMVNKSVGVDLHVVEMKGWKREMWFDETGLTWINPSPNIPTLETATVYPGTCLFEGVNFSEGRGTTRPFEFIGAPWIDAKKWAEELNNIKVNGVRFRACHFTPTFSKYSGELCNGVQVHVSNRDVFKPVETTLHMLATAIRLWSEEFEWLPPECSGHYHFDKLAGTNKIRKALSRGDSIDDIVLKWTNDLDAFEKHRKAFLIY